MVPLFVLAVKVFPLWKLLLTVVGFTLAAKVFTKAFSK